MHMQKYNFPYNSKGPGVSDPAHVQLVFITFKEAISVTLMSLELNPLALYNSSAT